MKVEQFVHANQFHIYDTKKAVDYLQSYDKTVVKIEVKTSQDMKQKSRIIITLGYYWDFSKTTATHVYEFLKQYGYISFNGIANKRAYVNELIKDGIITYDEGLE